MRFLLRFFSLVSLVLATIAGTIDSIRSVASSAVDMTSFGSFWMSVSPSSFEKLLSTTAAGDADRLYVSTVTWLLSQPAFGVLLVVSLLFWMMGYRKPSPTGRFVA